MAVGGIIKEQNLIVEYFTVASSEDIELGEIVVNAGSGLVAATGGLTTPTGPYFMAKEAHDYSEETEHVIQAVVQGSVDCQQKTGLGTIVEGRYVEISSTPGEVQIFDYVAGYWWDVVGIAGESVASTTTSHGFVLLGTYP